MAQYYNSTYQPMPTSDASAFYSSSQPSTSSNNDQFYSSNIVGSIGSSSSSRGGGSGGVSESYNVSGGGTVLGWWNAFGTGGMEGEPPLLEEIGLNFEHIFQKSLTVLNPLAAVDPHIMDDDDLYGPLVFGTAFALMLFLASKPQYIYAISFIGSVSLFGLLNLMSETRITFFRTVSVLGYCLLPLVLLSVLNVVFSLDSILGYIISFLAVVWCSFSASSIFVTVLHLHSQRVLIAYPIFLLYAVFALPSVFAVSTRLGKK